VLHAPFTAALYHTNCVLNFQLNQQFRHTSQKILAQNFILNLEKHLQTSIFKNIFSTQAFWFLKLLTQRLHQNEKALIIPGIPRTTHPPDSFAADFCMRNANVICREKLLPPRA
jgi:hypothetical protein